MSKKLKFKPEVIRVRLNPEQAVLACSCYLYGQVPGPGSSINSGPFQWVCTGLGRTWYGGTNLTSTECRHMNIVYSQMAGS